MCTFDMRKQFKIILMPQVLAILVGISLMMAVKPKHAANYK
jgi:hypothetical protein